MPTLPLDVKTPFSIVPIEASASCHVASAGISAGVPTRSVPTALNLTTEPGVKYSASVERAARTNSPVAGAVEITRIPCVVGLSDPSEGEQLILSSSPGR